MTSLQTSSDTHRAELAASAPASGVPSLPEPVRLSALRPGQQATVLGLRMPQGDHGHGRSLVIRLLEIGFVEGEPVRVMAIGPGGREPLAVRVGGTMFALRRHEAEHVLVRVEGAQA